MTYRRLFVLSNLVLTLILCQITFADNISVKNLTDSVNPEEIKTTIYDLQKNFKFTQPEIAYGSRFALRVKNTSNPSDEAFDNSAEYIFKKFVDYGLDANYDPFTISTGFDPRGRIAKHGGEAMKLKIS